MNEKNDKGKAMNPEEIAELFIRRANAGDVHGIVDLYESAAVLITGTERKVAKGSDDTRNFCPELLADNQQFERGEQRPAIRNGNLPFTSFRLVNGIVIAEVTKRQSCGSWLWLVDKPVIASETKNDE